MNPRLKSGYFITGTDTGVGKTYVMAALARRAVDLGRKVFAFKPIETGCQLENGQLVGEDQELICQAAGDWQRDKLRGVHQFAMAAAPLVAARAEAREVDLELIERTFEEGMIRADLTLVEGAGGWRVPIFSGLDMGGLAGRLGLPVIIVARAGLGTLNHTLLTAEAVERDRQRLVVVVLSERPSEPDDLVSTNVEHLQRHLGVAVIRLRTDSKMLDPLILAE